MRHDLRDPGVDPHIERTLGVKTFAELVESVLAEVDGYVGSDLRVDDQTLVAVVRRR